MNSSGEFGVVTNFYVKTVLNRIEPVDHIVLELITSKSLKVRTPMCGKRVLVIISDVILNPPRTQLKVYDGLLNTVTVYGKAQGVCIEIDQVTATKPVISWHPGIPLRLCVELSRREVCKRFNGRRICIDPGHGGTDSGAVRRHKEADVVLQTALILAKWLEKHGARVIMTRRIDQDMAWEERLRVLQQERAEMYIGLHAHSHPNADKRGTLVRYAANQGSKKLATSLNKAIMLGNDYLVDLGILPLEELVLPRTCPGVIVELENIRNLVGEGLLRDVDVQERIVQSSLHGLMEYLL
ncbi:MAG: N-acetylmuramoyl-L-alanine amidase [Limnochordia bacterium]|nr:N-acetylmuramoyl-L-alanine amidase [Limnochordia bacterium]